MSCVEIQIPRLTPSMQLFFNDVERDTQVRYYLPWIYIQHKTPFDETMVSSPYHHHRTFPLRLLGVLIIPFILVIPQVYFSSQLKNSFHDALDHHFSPYDNKIKRGKTTLSFPTLTKFSKEESFGACLMVKGDNELLYEWLAYHYTTLPLRYIFVASDVGNTENPSVVLNRWKQANTDLQFWIKNASTFIHRHGHVYGPVNSTEDVHHEFVHRKYLKPFSLPPSLPFNRMLITSMNFLFT
jgi:hypothetical protein